MRLDVFLKVSRLVKRRTVAKEACDHGRIRLNGRPAKPASSIAAGDTISLDYGSHVLTVAVLSVPDGPVRKGVAAELYRLVSDVPAEGNSDFLPEPH